MDQSRRAVETYWRTRMIDGVTADEDKVAPVYKLDEVCELLRTSPAGIVKEVSDYILKRLDHKSPVVKQKALRLIKYAVGKSGNEFRREMQRHSTVMRQLFHYKGQLDTLKGDALNKAVRDTAHEAIAAIFSTDDNKVVAPSNEGLGKRIQGFGNTNFEVVTEEKKSFLSEVVGLGSASIKQGFSTIASAHSSMKNDTGSYKGPTLRRSLTKEIGSRHEYEDDDSHRGSWTSSMTSKTTASGTWGTDSRPNIASDAATNDTTSSSNLGVKSREEKLLETIVTSGGVRLQPTRDALQTFLAEASKLDALSMSHALEMKLQSHLWQVRMKAVCVLEAILRKKDEEYFSIIASYFTDNRDSIIRCTELPQVSVREKAMKVLGLLGEEEITGARNTERSNTEAIVSPVLQVPGLIDTGDLEESNQDSTKTTESQSTININKTGSLVDDLFVQDPLADLDTNEAEIDNDPFADVSFHNSVENEQNDLFSGFTVDNKPSNSQISGKTAVDLIDVLGSNSEQLPLDAGSDGTSVNDLMTGLALNNAAQNIQQPGSVGASSGDFSGVTFLNDNSQFQVPTNGGLNGNHGLSDLYNQVPMQYNLPPNMIFNQGFPTQQMHYGSLQYLVAQQQLLLQNMGNFNPGYGHNAGNAMQGNHASPLPDIFQLSGNPVQSHASVANIPKKETKAFDFISDHLAAARDPKKVL